MKMKGGFALIESFVVISIIAQLLAILMLSMPVGRHIYGGVFEPDSQLAYTKIFRFHS